MADDPELLASWRAGDQAAGRALFQRYFAPLYRFFATKCDEPDELVQATFLAVVRARDQFEGRASFRTYLYQIGRHELYRHLRGRARTRDFDPHVSSIQALVTTPASRIARGEDHHRLLTALRALPVEQQTLLELHYWEDCDAAELGEILGVASGTIRVRLTRARAALREQMIAHDAAAAESSDDALDTWARALRGH